jgi:hypothetical protein
MQELYEIHAVRAEENKKDYLRNPRKRKRKARNLRETNRPERCNFRN